MKKLNWYTQRIGKVIWMTRTDCECRECVNAYINGIKIMNGLNAEGLHLSEKEHHNDKEFPVRFYDTWQERNKAEEDIFEESDLTIVGRINDLNKKMIGGQLEEKHNDHSRSRTKIRLIPIKRDEPKVHRNQECPCGSGLKYKKCCLNPNPN